MWRIGKVLTPPVIGCLLIAILSIGLAFRLAAGNRAPESPAPMVEHHEIEYRVNLRPRNGIIDEPSLGMGQTYIFSIVENIEIDNSYRSELAPSAETQYDYALTLAFVAKVEKEDPKDPDQVVIDEVIETLREATYQAQGDFSLDEQLVIDLARYRQRYLATQSRLDFPIEGEIRLDFTVQMSGDEFEMEAYTRSVVIPVSEPFFQIKLAGAESREARQVALESGGPKRFGSVMFGVIAVMALTLGAYLALKAYGQQASSRREVDKLLHGYRDMIIITTTPVNWAAYKERVVLKDAKELLKLAVNLDEPIMYYEAPEAACFYIPKGDVLFAYLVDVS
ncbi:DUF5305 domain-containing protein [Candidatus Saccharibacteria bacterium]|nr:DUF5305 domain-containing protein [Candidatus Saccharibacteria bacterium]